MKYEYHEIDDWDHPHHRYIMDDDGLYYRRPTLFTEKRPHFQEVDYGDRQALVAHKEEELDRLCVYWEVLTNACKSPIEFDLACELFHQCALERQRVPRIDRQGDGMASMCGYAMAPQMRLGRYTADFGVQLTVSEPSPGGDGIYSLSDAPHSFRARVIVECDGHAWHEKTKEQAAKDKRRDRFLLSQGWPVMRFTGSEIFADAAGCAEQVRDALNTQIQHDINETETFRQIARASRENTARWGGA